MAASLRTSGHNASTSATTLDVALTGIQAGDLLVAWVKHEGLTTTISVATSTSTDAFSAGTLVHHANGDLHGEFLYLLAATTTGSVTYRLTLGAARGFPSFHVWAFAPDAGETWTFDVQNTAQGSTAGTESIASGAVSTTGTDEVVLGGYSEYSGNQLSAPLINGAAADGSYIGYNGGAGDPNFSASWYKILAATFSSGTASATLTGGSSDFIVNVIALKSSSTAGADAPSVSDATTVTDTPVMNLKDMPSVFNSTTVDELIQMMMPVYASLNETVTVTDSSNVAGLTIPAGPKPNVNDAVTVSESVGGSLLTDGVFRQAAIAHLDQVTTSMVVHPRNALVAFVRWAFSTTIPNLLTVSDTNGNTWVLVENPTVLGSGVRVAAAVCINNAAVDTTPTIFANFDTPPADVWIAVHEVTNRDISLPLDVETRNVQGAASGTDSVTSGPVTTTRDSAYIFAASTESGSGVVTHPGTGFLMRTRDVPVSVGLITEDKIQTSAGTTSGTFSPDPAGTGYASIVVALRFARFWHPTVSDDVSVADVVGLAVTVALAPIVFENVTVTESVTMLEKPIQLPVSDTVTVTELAQGNVASQGISISVFDTVIMEGASAPFINVSDTINVTEIVLLTAQGLQVADSVTISDNVTVRLRIFINVHDDAMLIIMAEGGEYVTVTESVTLNFASFGSRQINVNDAVTVSELTNRQYNPMQMSVSDTASTVDAVATARTPNPSVFDSVSVTDVPSAALITTLLINVNDAVSVTENVLVIRASATVRAIAVSDDATVTEFSTIFGAPNVTVFDAVTVSEATVQSVVQLKLSVNDAVTIADAVSLSFPTVGALSLSETVTVTESVSMRLSLIRLSVFEDVSVGEGRDVAANPILLSVGDNVSIDDEPFAFAGDRAPSPRIRGMFAWEHWIRRES